MQETRILYDSFNARNVSHAQIAETFVSNSDFFNLAKNNHTVILGPRGCGKTTLFKMLTTPALKNWAPKTVEELNLKKGIPFLAIYIPSDEVWKDQLNSIKDSLINKEKLYATFTKALITTNILSNFCNSIKDHIDLQFEKNAEFEYEFSENLIKEWMLSDCAPTILSVRQALISRKKKLRAKIDKAIFYHEDDDFNIELDDCYFLDYIEAIHVACIVFERIYNNGNEIKWALCFDELELVSKEFFSELIAKLRIAPPNILFKLSTSPLAEFKDSIAQSFHDFDIIKMWPFDIEQEDRYQKFCEAIAVQKIKRIRDFNNIKRHSDIDLSQIFGELDYNLYALKSYRFDIDVSAKESESNSLTWFAFKELAKTDLSLSSLMDKRGIDPENPVPRTQKNYDSFIRKSKEIVINRLVFNQYNKNDKQIKAATKKLKIFPIYYGKKTILNICEGNPRFIIGVLNDMINEIALSENIEILRISPPDQSKMIRDISDRYLSMLHTYPTTQKLGSAYLDLEWLIKKVGNYFDKEINRGEFKLHPATSFYVNEDLRKEYYDILKIGVDLGAFIKIDNNENLVSISKKTETRYRLSYLLAPQFKLPLRLYSSVNLEKILRTDKEINSNLINFDVNES